MRETSFKLNPTIGKIIESVDYVRKNINPDFAITQFYLLMLVAQNEGVTQRVLCEMADMPHGTVSRNLKQMGVYNVRTKEGEIETKGYDLIELRYDMFDRRITEVHLTEKGKRVVQKLTDILEGS